MIISVLKEEELSPQTLRWYRPPPEDGITKLGLEMHWYSYYHM